MEGIVVQFRRGRHRIHEKHYLLDLGMGNRGEASKLVGKEVEWKSPAGKVIKGKISSTHGNKGLVRAIFEKGLPGQAITTSIKLEGSVGDDKDKGKKGKDKKDNKKGSKEKDEGHKKEVKKEDEK